MTQSLPPARSGVLLGHAKLDTTARYAQVATRIIRDVMSPLDAARPGGNRDAKPPD